MARQDLIYKPSAVKHFRRLAEEWRSLARDRRKVIKNMEKRRSAGEMDQGYYNELRELTMEAEIYEKLGKQLKVLSSDVLNDRVGIL